MIHNGVGLVLALTAVLAAGCGARTDLRTPPPRDAGTDAVVVDSGADAGSDAQAEWPDTGPLPSRCVPPTEPCHWVAGESIDLGPHDGTSGGIEVGISCERAQILLIVSTGVSPDHAFLLQADPWRVVLERDVDGPGQIDATPLGWVISSSGAPTDSDIVFRWLDTELVEHRRVVLPSALPPNPGVALLRRTWTRSSPDELTVVQVDDDGARGTLYTVSLVDGSVTTYARVPPFTDFGRRDDGWFVGVRGEHIHSDGFHSTFWAAAVDPDGNYLESEEPIAEGFTLGNTFHRASGAYIATIDTAPSVVRVPLQAVRIAVVDGTLALQHREFPDIPPPVVAPLPAAFEREILIEPGVPATGSERAGPFSLDPVSLDVTPTDVPPPPDYNPGLFMAYEAVLGGDFWYIHSPTTSELSLGFRPLECR